MTETLVDEYVKKSTWRINSNANWNFSHSGMQSHIAGTVLAKDALTKLGKFGKKHLNGDYHIHNLEGGIYGRYCNGNDLLTLLQKGLINIGGVRAKPASHFSSLLDQISNFTYLMTGEFQGAQGWNYIDVLVAPFIKKDGLTYEQVKQEVQQLIWNLSFNLRPGYQSPFCNFTLGLRPSKFYTEMSPIIGGEPLKATYSDFRDEIDMFNNAFLDIMIDGPGDGKPFTFPLPTYNITKDFDWDSEISYKIFDLASTWGSPYFSNLVNSDLSENDITSMCCRIRINHKEIQKVSGGIWSLGNNTGALAVHTTNMPRLGYLSNGNEKKFYRLLDSALEDGKNYLLQKKEWIKKGDDIGLFPMTSEYIGDKLYKTYFLTFGQNGLNECSINFCEQNIIENVNWCEEVTKYISEKILGYQEETGQLMNFEEVPGEGCSHSLARIDKEKFPDIFAQGTENAPYYTSASQIPYNIEMTLVDAIKHQERFKQHYTGGSVFHIDSGEACSPESVRNLIRKVCNNSTIPYMTWNPSYVVCKKHGKTFGKEQCCNDGEVINRVVGYLRSTNTWGIGKKQEYKEKKFLRM